MAGRWTIGAQLSTSHSRDLDPQRVFDTLKSVLRIIDLDLLVVGAREAPEIFRGLCGEGPPIEEVFLWYNLLSDIEGMDDSDLVVNWRGERSRGWGGWAEQGAAVSETFRFVCPNNPAAREKTLRRLRELVTRYAFSGVFLDKMRFPSPANGLDEVISCFCDHCRDAARASDLDLDTVIRLIEQRAIDPDVSALDDAGGQSWLESLGAANPLLGRFLRFRMDSITRLVAEVRGETSRAKRKLALDLFSPGVAGLVGQDYPALARHCVWAKPMTYRVALGPAGLRLEVPALADGVGSHFGIDQSSIAEWAALNVKGFDRDTLRQTCESAVPLQLIIEEIRAAVRLMNPAPVYFGLELVRHPGVIDITPALVRDMVGAGRAADAAGLIISWDLIHAPKDGLAELASCLLRDAPGRPAAEAARPSLLSSPRRRGSSRRSPW